MSNGTDNPSQGELYAPLNLVVLAAGMGSRYGGLKQMEGIGPGGERMLDYSVHDAIAAGFQKIVFVIRRDFAEAFRRSVVSRYDGLVDVAIAYQDLNDLPGDHVPPEGREKPWGTAHAVYAARHVVDGPFAVINADDYYGPEAYRAVARELSCYLEDEVALCMAGYALDHTLSEHGGVNRGVCEVERGHLRKISEYTDIRRTGAEITGCAPGGERKPLAADTPVSMNFWGFNLGFMDVVEGVLRQFLKEHKNDSRKECYLPVAVDSLLVVGGTRCTVLKTESRWFGITYPEDRDAVCEAITRQRGGLWEEAR